MFSAADLPDKIALFPLPRALLLPHGRLPLQIFEPRYLAMLDDTLKTSHRLIGMIQPSDGSNSKLYEVGCAGRLVSFNETDDGRYMITLAGVSRFRVKQLVEGFTPYLKADADWSSFGSDLVTAESSKSFDRADFFGLLSRYFEVEGLSTDWDAIKEAKDELLINSLCMLCPFGVEEKQALLEAETLDARAETLQALMEFALAGGGSQEEVMQ